MTFARPLLHDSKDLRSLKHILLIEAESEGHHPLFAAAMANALRAQGHQLTLAMPKTETSREKLKDAGFKGLSNIDWIDWRQGGGISMLAEVSRLTAALNVDIAFFNCFDQVASELLRRAAWGWRPEGNLHGKISGLYIRPRPLDPDCKRSWWPNSFMKRLGWRSLDKEGWFKTIFVLDERLPSHSRRVGGVSEVRFLPEPNSKKLMQPMSAQEARRKLAIPEEAKVFLHYGIGSRRKGLHHIIRAWQELPIHECPYLLSAGRLEREFKVAMQMLASEGRAKVLDYYLTQEEEHRVFAAADIVLLPYVNHYGSSNVLSRAAANGRMVLASDHGLLGYRVREYGLGKTYRHNDYKSFLNALLQLSTVKRETIAMLYTASLNAYSEAGSDTQFLQASLI